MKIRQGFVSNSSSSSFILAIKSDKDLKTFLKNKINGNFLKSVLDEIIDVIVVESKETSKEELQKMYWVDDDEFEIQFPKESECFDKGMKVYTGNFNTDDGGVECFLASFDIYEEEDDFYLNIGGI